MSVVDPLVLAPGSTYRGLHLQGRRVVGDGYGAALVDCTFVGCELDGTDLTEAHLRGCVLDRCSLHGVSLNGATVEGSRLTGSCRWARACPARVAGLAPDRMPGSCGRWGQSPARRSSSTPAK